MRLIPPFAIFFLATAAQGFGQLSHVNVKAFDMSPALSKKISESPTSNISANIPKNTPVTTVSVAEKDIPKNPTAVEAGKFLLNKGVTCCEPLEHAHDNWYWCCDKAKLIQIEGGSQSAKVAFENVLSKASKLDDRAWARLRTGSDTQQANTTRPAGNY